MKNIIIGLLTFSFYSVTAQTIEVDVKIDKLSPFIKRYSKEQMEQILLDSVVAQRQRELSKFGNTFKFYAKQDSVKSEVPDYKLQLLVTDSMYSKEQTKKVVLMVMVRSNLYEGNVATDAIEGWMKCTGMGPWVDSASILEDKVIKGFIEQANLGSSIIVDYYLPISLNKVMLPKNLPTPELRLFDFNSTVNISIETDFAQQSDELLMMMVMIQNSFNRLQNLYRGAKRGRAYFNYCFVTEESACNQESNPLTISFQITPDQEGYRVELKTDDSRVTLDPPKSTAYISNDEVKQRKSIVNNKIFSLVTHFYFKNL